MRRLFSFLLALNFLTGSFAVHAQDVLDRVDPTRIEDRKVEQVQEKPVTTTTTGTSTAAAAPNTSSIRVGAIEIVGLDQLKNSYFSDIVQEYIGNTLASDEVATLVDKLAARARDRFPLASARIIPQNVIAGIIRVEVDEGRVDAIELNGFQNRLVKATLERLAQGRPVTTIELERAILLARDIDGVAISDTRIRREGDRNILVVKGYYDRFRAQLTFDNDSTKPIGPFEALGFAQANGIFSHNDSLQAYVLAALPQPEELAFLRLQYSSRIDQSGTEVSLAGSISRSRPGSYFAPFDIVGDSRWASVGISKPIERSAAASLWIDSNISIRELEQDRAGSRSRMDRLTVARARLLGSAKLAGGIVQSSVTLSKGLDILNATKPGDPFASRPDADGRFTTAQFYGQWSRALGDHLEIKVAAFAQLANRPLLVSEEIGLGGARFVRGYDYSERTGDEGAMGYIELAYDVGRKVGPFAGIKPYAFADGGQVSDVGQNTGRDSLFSAGGGIRFDVDNRTDASFEIAAPLSGDRYETDSQAPRLRFSVTRYF